jgi:hypothetical protein
MTELAGLGRRHDRRIVREACGTVIHGSHSCVASAATVVNLS